MIKVENINVSGFEAAVRGMRNPKNSWKLSDSGYCMDKRCDLCVQHDSEFNECKAITYPDYAIGNADLSLMKKLLKAGPEHRKYLRMIHVSMDITCHSFWWPEFDTYKIGVTRNSCSKMHKIHVKEFEKADFSHEGIDEVGVIAQRAFDTVIIELERLRCEFNETGDQKYWRALLELLPHGFNLKATVDMNYEDVLNIIRQRENHKVFEWTEYVNVLKELPYVKELIK